MPIRTCAGCRSRRPQDELLRIVRGPAGDVSVDTGPRGAKPGRGAYVCPDRSCIRAAMKGGFRRALRYGGSLPAVVEDDLLARIQGEREGNDGKTEGP